MVEDVEKDRICAFTDWIGDSYYRVQSWIGQLNIRYYINDVDSYHRKVLDKNNTSKREIVNIFTRVSTVDARYHNKLILIWALLGQWDRFIVQLGTAVNPENKNFTSTYIQSLMDGFSIDELTDVISAPDFTAPVYFYNEPDQKNALKNLLDFFSGVEGLAENYLPTEIATIIGKLNNISNLTTIASWTTGIIGYTQAVTTLLDPSKNSSARDRVQNLLKVDRGLLGIYSTLLNLAKESEIAGLVGLVKTSMGTISELLNATGRSIEEQLKESGGLITIGTALAKATWRLAPEGKLEAFYMKHASKAELREARLKDYGNIAAAVTAISMITRSIGDIVEKTRDGVYDINDYGDTLMDVGQYGLKTLVSSVTLGTVNADMDRTKAIFDYNIETGQKLIQNTCGDSVVGKVLLTPFVIVDVAAISAAETIIDTGMQIGDNIRNLFGWGKKK